MLTFVADHLKVIIMCKHGVKKLPYLLKHVSDQYKTQQMCDKAVFENGATLKSVPDCCKNKEMCDKAADNYPHPLELFLNAIRLKQMCDKTVDTQPPPPTLPPSPPATIKYVPECCKTQEMLESNSYLFFVFDSILDQYKTQEICDIVISLYHSLYPNRILPNSKNV